MAELTKETIKYLSELSRIGCTDEEMETLLQDLRAILSHVDKLQELDTENVEPCDNVLQATNVMRKDEVKNVLPHKTFIAMTPQSTGGLVRVPTVQKKG